MTLSELDFGSSKYLAKKHLATALNFVFCQLRMKSGFSRFVPKKQQDTTGGVLKSCLRCIQQWSLLNRTSEDDDHKEEYDNDCDNIEDHLPKEKMTSSPISSSLLRSSFFKKREHARSMHIFYSLYIIPYFPIENN